MRKKKINRKRRKNDKMKQRLQRRMRIKLDNLVDKTP